MKFISKSEAETERFAEELAKKYPVCIVSNCEAGYIELVCDKLGIKDCINNYIIIFHFYYSPFCNLINNMLQRFTLSSMVNFLESLMASLAILVLKAGLFINSFMYFTVSFCEYGLCVMNPETLLLIIS